MNEYKINTDIISATGITIDSRNISTSTGKVVINNVEVTDIDSWNKAISTFSELENKINNLQSKIEKAIEMIEFDKKDRMWDLGEGNVMILQEKRVNELLNTLKEDK